MLVNELMNHSKTFAKLLPKTTAALANKLGVSWRRAKRVRELIENGASNEERKTRTPTENLKARRKALSQIAKKKCRLRSGREKVCFPSARLIGEELRRTGGPSLSRWTVRRDLMQAGLKNFVRRKVPCKQARPVNKRRAFCSYWRRQIIAKTDKIVFSDEHTICTNDFSCRTMYAKSVKDVVTRERMRKHNIPHIMVWGAIGMNWRSPLVMFEGTLCGERYIRLCLSKVAVDLVTKQLTLQQDGARPHVKKCVKTYCERKNLQVLENWPPYSPDLNPIEQLWAELDRRIAEKGPETLDELKEAAKRAWQEVPTETLNNYVCSFRTKVSRVSKQDGAA